MNKVFKVVFNAVRNKMMVVNEMTSSMQVGRKKARVAMVVGATILAFSGAGYAAVELINISPIGDKGNWVIPDSYNFYTAGSEPNNNKVLFNEEFSTQEVNLYGYKGGLTAGFSNSSNNSQNNSFTIKSGSFINLFITGGYSAISNAQENSVSISGGSIKASQLAGGLSETESATKNIVTISGGNVDIDLLVGGLSFGSGSVTGNQVSVSTGVFGEIDGGYSSSGSITDNKVTINNATVESVYGGQSGSGSSVKNKVSISNSTVGTVYGGYSYFGSSEGNTVIFNSGTYTDIEVYGGKTEGDYVEHGNANGNTVVITGTTKVLSGGGEYMSLIYGGYSCWGSANNNVITIEGGEVKPAP